MGNDKDKDNIPRQGAQGISHHDRNLVHVLDGPHRFSVNNAGQDKIQDQDRHQSVDEGRIDDAALFPAQQAVFRHQAQQQQEQEEEGEQAGLPQAFSFNIGDLPFFRFFRSLIHTQPRRDDPVIDKDAHCRQRETRNKHEIPVDGRSQSDRRVDQLGRLLCDPIQQRIRPRQDHSRCKSRIGGRIACDQPCQRVFPHCLERGRRQGWHNDNGSFGSNAAVDPQK